MLKDQRESHLADDEKMLRNLRILDIETEN